MKTCTKNLFIWLVATLLVFGGMIYLVSITTPVGAEKETEKDYSIIFESIVERDENRQERIKEREEIRTLYEEIEVKKERIRELEARADELNIIINGEEGL